MLPARLALFLFVLPVSLMAEERPQPLVVAHRGLLRHAPENTLPNFRACLELRMGFEFDVGQTKDGHLVCIHDTTVNRTTNGTGKVAELTLAQIRELDAGSWFGPEFAGAKIPTVAEVLQLVAQYRQHNILVTVDLKAANVSAEVVRLAEKQKVLHRLLFIGRTISDPATRKAIQKASSNTQIAAVANNPDEFQTALKDPVANWVYVRYLPTPKETAATREAGKKMFIAGSTVSGNVPKNWHHANNVGLDAILTDYPLDLRGLLRKQRK